LSDLFLFLSVDKSFQYIGKYYFYANSFRYFPHLVAVLRDQTTAVFCSRICTSDSMQHQLEYMGEYHKGLKKGMDN